MHPDTSSAAKQDDAAHVMDALRRVVRALRLAERESEMELGLTAAQLFVLREVDKAEEPTIGELTRRTATAQSSLSEVVSRLLAKRLVERAVSVVDHRRAILTVTPAGREVLVRASETVQERLLGAFHRLEPDRRRQLAQALTDWVAESGLDQVMATMFFEECRSISYARPEKGRRRSRNLPDSSADERIQSSAGRHGLDRAALFSHTTPTLRSPKS